MRNQHATLSVLLGLSVGLAAEGCSSSDGEPHTVAPTLQVDAGAKTADAGATPVAVDPQVQVDAGAADSAAPDAHAPTPTPTPTQSVEAGVDAFVCDGSKDPSAEPCVISEAYGVFIAPGGSDASGDGTRAAPWRTFTYALSKVTGPHPRIYACSGTYAESVTVAAANDGVSIYGGFSCPSSPGSTDWMYAGTRALVAPSAAGYALMVSGLTTGLHVEDMAFTSIDADPATPGASSIAVLVSSSSNVSFSRVSGTSGAGTAGLAAAALTASNWGSASNAAGAPGGFDGTGGAGGTLTCAGATSTSQGGVGGVSSLTPTAGGPGTDSPGLNGIVGGAGGLPIHVPSPHRVDGCAVGSPGPAGPAVNGGVAAGYGALTANGFVPATASAGYDGYVGEGGGGGGGYFSGQGGGGGGAGGCGGLGGLGGTSGGASFAFAVIDSQVAFAAVDLYPGAGGSGGAGSAGEPGQPGSPGAAGPNDSFVAACGGGAGGGGAGGGGGGGGSGGPSAGIAWTGAIEPTVDGTMVMPNMSVGNPSTFRPGATSIEGAGGSGGAHGDPTQAPSLPGQAGFPGYSAPVLGL